MKFQRLGMIVAMALGMAPALAKAQAIAVELPTVIGPPAAAALNPQQLDELLAPVALYPDPLLTDILAASTYPAQIVEAQRFVADPAQAGLSADALMDAAVSRGWDPSVQALLPFRQVLALLDARLEWTDRLGRAFAAQPDDVLNAVQRLRRRAQAAGYLASGLQDNVTQDGGAIAILPPSPQAIAVPSYDPACVYGADAGCGGAASIAWDDSVFLPFDYGQWGRVSWRDRRIHWRAGGDHGADGHVVRTAPDGDATGAVWRHDERRSGPRDAAMPFQYAPPAGERLLPATAAPRMEPGGVAGFGRDAGGFRGGVMAAPRAPALHTSPAAGAVGHPAMAAPAAGMANASIGRR